MANRFREELMAETRSYAQSTPHAEGSTLDCSLGTNPYGFPAGVEQALQEFDCRRLFSYPHGNEARAAIVKYWEDYAFIEPENIVQTDGSISALYLLCNILARPGARVVGFLPTFTDMVEYARVMGMNYVGIATRREEGFRRNVDRLIEAVDKDTSLVYIDNPCNPTGESLPLEEISRVLEKCEQLGVYTIVDEAYADFLPREESAVTLGPSFHHMISVRTFSKGYGLAGLRAGYIISNQELIRYLNKVSNPYMMSELSRVLAAAALQSPEHAVAHAADFAAVKQAIREAGEDVISMAATDDRVPICLLTHKDPVVDLQARLLLGDVLTCHGADFEPLEQNSVRLRIPPAEDAPRVIAAIRAAR
ncbi:MAG: histidinol-phosphate aminotransferase family protein [Clostridia bacterium]|nr:histidinol-phosphate aminotransferase family protein [Clostridia bacterium]